MKTTPSEVVSLIRRYYPQFEDHTNIGSRQDLRRISGIVDALEAIPDQLIPRELRGAFIEVRGRFRSAVRTWEGGGLTKYYLSGRDLSELISVLARGSDSQPSSSIDPTVIGRIDQLKPLIFISCGQYTQDEIALGKAIEELVRQRTNFDAYFAEQQNSLEGLSANILSSLGRCVGFVAVAHHRGVVSRPNDTIVRASVWIEQELAIAAFIQHALKRKIEVALYLQKGIYREGIREQLRLAPVMFETSADVLADFESRLTSWRLETPRTHSLRAEWRFETYRQTQDRHDYRFHVDLVNDGATQITDWKLRVEFPRQFVDAKPGAGDAIYEDDSSNYSSSAGRLYAGQRLPSIINMPYVVDDTNYDTIKGDEPSVKLWLWSGDMPPLRDVIPMSKLNEY